MSQPYRNTRQTVGQRGFTLVEVGLSLGIFSMMLLMFGAIFPLALRASQMSNDYMQAETLVQQKLDDARQAGYSNLNTTGLQGAQVIDNPQPSGYPSTSGTSTTYSFTSADNLANYFPAGVVGTLTVTPDANAPSGTAYDVSANIAWSGEGNLSRSFSATTKIINR
jgi:type II secretory pathway pseudopilin PulG